MSETSRLHIQKEYERIMKLLEGGRIYGEEVDTLDIRMLVVAAYYCGAMTGDYIRKMTAERELVK